MSKDNDIDCNITDNIKVNEEATTGNKYSTSTNATEKLDFDIKKSELNPDANAYTTKSSMFDPSYPSLSSIIESAFPNYDYVGLNTNFSRGDFASRLGFQSNMPSDNSSALYWDKECDRKVQDVKGLNNNCGNSLTPPRMKLSSLISPIITSGSYHTEDSNLIPQYRSTFASTSTNSGINNTQSQSAYYSSPSNKDNSSAYHQQVTSPSMYNTASIKSPSQKLTLREMQQQSQLSADGFIYKVHFKRAPRNFVLAPQAPRTLKVGDYVKVEADRGEDLGCIVAKIAVNEFKEFQPTAGYRGRGFSTGQTEKKFLIRIANIDEMYQLLQKFRDEADVLRVIREKVTQRMLPMAILDAEYQFDRHKLVFFFEADHRVDFRDLVSDLFSLYKTRIWMQQVDTTSIPDEDYYPYMPTSPDDLVRSEIFQNSIAVLKKNIFSPASVPNPLVDAPQYSANSNLGSSSYYTFGANNNNNNNNISGPQMQSEYDYLGNRFSSLSMNTDNTHTSSEYNNGLDTYGLDY